MNWCLTTQFFTDKPTTKPVQPVAPMMAAKTAPPSATRILPPNYGPIGSGIPSRSQTQPIQRPSPAIEPMSIDQGNVSSVHDMGVSNVPISLQNQGTPVNGMMTSTHSMGMQMMTSVSSLPNPIPHSATHTNQGAMQNTTYRNPMSSVQTQMSTESTPRTNVGVTPVRNVNPNFPDGASDGEGESAHLFTPCLMTYCGQ